ncbi:hypothetical protein BKM31_41850 [[Actinomadura] parvosata subsp. kistnae]|uniref:Uncharacterized protein n=1 Tax=[Actinomadura] parvosata subsp. kistnae TaxID=1909395 RepID=A0A1V0AAD2_9ACTN|nr:hypothetical protein BKM31_41850 [Nonomuraea sp. ATCC 55076]
MMCEFGGVQERDGCGEGRFPYGEIGVLEERGHGAKDRGTKGPDFREYRVFFRQAAQAHQHRFDIVADFISYGSQPLQQLLT